MIRRIVIGALIVFIGLATVLTVLLGTEPGTRWVLRHAAGLAPGTLSFERSRGTLLRGLEVEAIDFEQVAVSAQLERLHIRVNAAALFAGRLAITRLDLHGLDLRTRPDPEPTPSEPFRMPEAIALPLAIDLAPARFTQLSLRFGDAEPLLIDEIRLAGSVDRETLHIRILTVESPDLDLELTARAGLAMPYPLQLELGWRTRLPAPLREGLAADAASGQLTLGGDLQSLTIRHRVEGPVKLSGEGALRDLLDTPAWDLEHRWAPLTWHLPDGDTVRLGEGRLHGEGTLADYRVSLDTTITALDLPSQQLRLTGQGHAEGFSALSLDLAGEAGRLTLEGSAGWLPGPMWDLAVKGRDLDTSQASAELPGRLDLDARVTGGFDDTGALDMEVEGLELAGILREQSLRVQGSGRVSDTEVTTPGITVTVDGSVLEVEGRAGWQPQPHWDLRVEGRDLDPGPWLTDWPGRLAVTLESAGRLEAGNAVHGEVRVARLEGQLAGHSVSAGGEATLHGHGLSTPGLRITADEAQLAVSGEADWAPVPRWNLQVEADALDPGLIDPRLAGRLSLLGSTEGRLEPEVGVSALIRLDRLDGTLRDYPVSARGDARVEEGRRLTTPGFEARVGANRLELQGHAEPESADLRYRIDAPALEALWPGLQGRLAGDGHLQGAWHDPDLDLRLRGEGLGYDGWSLERLTLQARGALRPDNPLTVNLMLAGAARDDQVLAETLTLEAGGRAEAHRFSLNARTPEGRLGLRAEGRLTDAPGWAGRLTRLNLTETRMGDWRLVEAAPLEADARHARLAPLCVSRQTARLCLEGERDPDEGLRALVDLSELPLAWLAAWLPENVALEGALSASARLRHLDDDLAVESRARIPAGEVHVLGQDGERHVIPFRDLTLDAALDQGVLQSRAGLSLLDEGRLSAELRMTPEGETHRLEGRARANVQELRWLEVAVPQVRDPQGRLTADLTVAGTLETPDFRGEVRLSDGRAMIPDLGLELADLQVRAGAAGLDRLTVEGQVTSGPGQLELQGELGVTPEGTPWSRMTLGGERFRAVRRPEAEVLVSPDLAMETAAREVRLTGQLRIPEASIELRELPAQAVSVSRDEVIVDAEEPEPPWQVFSRVTVTLGDQVRLSGFGLSARLAGEVAVQDSPARPTRVEGEVRIEDGRYRAYGQNLTVERGVLVFQGPADNPGLDIRAVRRVPAYDVTAGLAIGGTLQDPRSRVFSTPAMEDSEAMSYLLTGRPLSGASEADANVLAAAITAFGVEQGGLLTRQIGQAVGLDEFTLAAEGEMEEGALLMGKQLSSRLYVRYTVGLFERASTLMLRYSLSRTLSLETQSSEDAQSMDLIYRRER
jgi:translocation and assembly module TamB